MAHKTTNKPNPSAEKREPKAEPIRRMVRVAIFDDSPEINLAYSDCFASFLGVEVVTSKPVFSADDALEIFRTLRPDVVITDLSLTEGNKEGFEILKRIKEISPDTLVGLSTSSYHPNTDNEINREIRKHAFDMLFQKHDLASMCDFISGSAPEPGL